MPELVNEFTGLCAAAARANPGVVPSRGAPNVQWYYNDFPDKF